MNNMPSITHPQRIDLKPAQHVMPKSISVITHIALAILTAICFTNLGPIVAFVIVASAGLGILKLKSLFLKMMSENNRKEAVLYQTHELVTPQQNESELRSLFQTIKNELNQKEALLHQTRELVTTQQNEIAKLTQLISQLERTIDSQKQSQAYSQATIDSLQQQINDLKEQQGY